MRRILIIIPYINHYAILLIIIPYINHYAEYQSLRRILIISPYINHDCIIMTSQRELHLIVPLHNDFIKITDS